MSPHRRMHFRYFLIDFNEKINLNKKLNTCRQIFNDKLSEWPLTANTIFGLFFAYHYILLIYRYIRSVKNIYIQNPWSDAVVTLRIHCMLGRCYENSGKCLKFSRAIKNSILDFDKFGISYKLLAMGILCDLLATWRLEKLNYLDIPNLVRWLIISYLGRLKAVVKIYETICHSLFFSGQFNILILITRLCEILCVNKQKFQHGSRLSWNRNGSVKETQLKKSGRKTFMLVEGWVQNKFVHLLRMRFYWVKVPFGTQLGKCEFKPFSLLCVYQLIELVYLWFA